MQKSAYICKTCDNDKQLSASTCSWFYDGVKKKFRRFGSAKIVRTLIQARSLSDEEDCQRHASDDERQRPRYGPTTSVQADLKESIDTLRESLQSAEKRLFSELDNDTNEVRSLEVCKCSIDDACKTFLQSNANSSAARQELQRQLCIFAGEDELDQSTSDYGSDIRTDSSESLINSLYKRYRERQERFVLRALEKLYNDCVIAHLMNRIKEDASTTDFRSLSSLERDESVSEEIQSTVVQLNSQVPDSDLTTKEDISHLKTIDVSQQSPKSFLDPSAEQDEDVDLEELESFCSAKETSLPHFNTTISSLTETDPDLLQMSLIDYEALDTLKEQRELEENGKIEERKVGEGKDGEDEEEEEEEDFDIDDDVNMEEEVSLRSKPEYNFRPPTENVFSPYKNMKNSTIIGEDNFLMYTPEGDNSQQEVLSDDDNLPSDIDRFSIDSEEEDKLENLDESYLDSPSKIDIDEGSPCFVVSPPKKTTINLGDMASITCTIEGSLPITVQWFSSQTQLESDEKYEIGQVDSDIHSLDIYNCKAIDSGTYRILLTNEKGSAEKKFDVIVKEDSISGGMKPRLIEGLRKTYSVRSGDDAFFFFSITAFPIPRVAWYIDSQLVNATNFPNAQSTKYKKDYSLYIKQVTKSSIITVKAFNFLGEIESSCSLKVLDENANENESIYPSEEDLNQIASIMSDKTDKRNDVENFENSINSVDSKLENLDTDVQLLTPQPQDSFFDVDLELRNVNICVRSLREINKKPRLFRQMSSALDAIHQTLTDIERSQSVRERRLSEPSQNVVSLRHHFIEEEDIEDFTEKVELYLPFDDYETLYIYKLIDRTILRQAFITERQMASVKKVLIALPSLKEKLAMEDKTILLPDISEMDGNLVLNCGLKRVNSKRYKRDYNINRSGQKGQPEVKPFIKEESQGQKAKSILKQPNDTLAKATLVLVDERPELAQVM
ncbi:DgyrCDS10714 [Dimorphilus gyrociliatus]|uniref:DgyrCDS10714 n=1 Tax=Dimorphilus gyrociliatus TaxID=2664684 RepID=A0A7I8W121_9ANNE|nr:DgyrCDS10714 [Dimorphilus gyrociliatus]